MTAATISGEDVERALLGWPVCPCPHCGAVLAKPYTEQIEDRKGQVEDVAGATHSCPDGRIVTFRKLFDWESDSFLWTVWGSTGSWAFELDSARLEQDLSFDDWDPVLSEDEVSRLETKREIMLARAQRGW